MPFRRGLNCAESVNFALDRWEGIGSTAKHCKCVPDAFVLVAMTFVQQTLMFRRVRIDVKALHALASARENATPEPEKVRSGRSFVVKRRISEVSEPNRKKQKKEPARQCAMCPDTSDSDLLPLKGGKLFVHRLCASFTPETSIHTSADGIESVHGFDDISNSRLRLVSDSNLTMLTMAEPRQKCMACKGDPMMGSKIQCTVGNCARALSVPRIRHCCNVLMRRDLT